MEEFPGDWPPFMRENSGRSGGIGFMLKSKFWLGGWVAWSGDKIYLNVVLHTHIFFSSFVKGFVQLFNFLFGLIGV